MGLLDVAKEGKANDMRSVLQSNRDTRNTHIGCKNPSLKVELLCWPGCGIFPISFDENIVQSCDHKDVPGDAGEDTPITKLIRIMG